MLKGDVKGARSYLLSFVHTQPWLARSWSTLSLFLLQNSPREARGAARLAAKTRVLRQTTVDNTANDGNNDNTGSDEVMAAVALLMTGREY